MNRLIRDVYVTDVTLSPTAAEFWIGVTLAAPLPGATLRGRLMGPRCRYASTVEVAYPLHGLEYGSEANLIRRVVIPEPNWWDVTSPFLYQGPVEVWQDGQLRERIEVTHGLRVINFGAEGMRFNGKPFVLHGMVRSFWFEEELLQLRRAGINCILAPWESIGLCEAADRVGMLVIARLSAANFEDAFVTGNMHPSFVGIVVSQDLLSRPECRDYDEKLLLLTQLADAASNPLYQVTDAQRREELQATRRRYGIELQRVPTAPLPAWASFVACPEALLPQIEAIALPKLVLGRASSGQEAAPGILGWIDAPA